mgnify:CR=1 FL=1
MKETVLLYNFNDKDRLMKIRQALLPLGFRVKTVGREDYGKPLGTLAGVRSFISSLTSSMTGTIWTLSGELSG